MTLMIFYVYFYVLDCFTCQGHFVYFCDFNANIHE